MNNAMYVKNGYGDNNTNVRAYVDVHLKQYYETCSYDISAPSIYILLNKFSTTPMLIFHKRCSIDLYKR